MKKFVLAFAAVAMSAGVAFAENPHVGEPANLYGNDRTPVATQSKQAERMPVIHTNQGGSANRFGDASPTSIMVNSMN